MGYYDAAFVGFTLIWIKKYKYNAAEVQCRLMLVDASPFQSVRGAESLLLLYNVLFCPHSYMAFDFKVGYNLNTTDTLLSTAIIYRS